MSNDEDRTAGGRATARQTGKNGHEPFARKTDAERFLSTIEADKIRGDWTDPRLRKRSFGDWAEEVEASRGRQATVDTSA